MASRRGMGSLYRPKYRYNGETRESAVWWCSYSVNGRKLRESTSCKKQKEAADFLKQRLKDVGLYGPSPRDVTRVMFEDMVQQLRSHFRHKAEPTTRKRLKTALNHLEPAFSGWRLIDIRPPAVQAYRDKRVDAGAAPSTVNWEIGILRLGFNLCVDPAELLRPADVPSFKKLMLKEDNVRTGFITEAEMQPLLEALRKEHQGWAEFGYITGWRIKSEVLSREWRHVDFENGWVRLEPHEAKCDEAREFPLNEIPRLRAVLERQWERKQRIERECGVVVKYVFTYDDGSQIKAPVRSWRTACKRVGLDLIPHDFRRSAVRNLERSGISRSVAMKLVGHKSESIYRRYYIGDEIALREAGQKLSRLFDNEPESERKVVGSISGGQRTVKESAK